jgi:SAM-dependent methyltransferase
MIQLQSPADAGSARLKYPAAMPWPASGSVFARDLCENKSDLTSNGSMTSTRCKVCGGESEAIGSLPGAVTSRAYHIRRWLKYDFVSVDDPCLDFAAIYDDAHCHGKGADPFDDYYAELERPQAAVRQYEWRGIPILSKDELEQAAGSFSVVTLIEVIEHIPDPLPFLRNVRRFLKPDGLLFLTTGNSAPYRNRFLKWRHIHPEVHVSYFNPWNMRLAIGSERLPRRVSRLCCGVGRCHPFQIPEEHSGLGNRRLGAASALALLSRSRDLRVKPSVHPRGPGRIAARCSEVKRRFLMQRKTGARPCRTQ